MNKEELLKIFYGKEKWNIWYEFQNIEKNIEYSNDLYDNFDEIKNMLFDEKSYIRMRGFRIICRLSKWDKDNKIDNIINDLLNVLNDDKPTIVRKCLETLDTLFLNKPNLSDKIEDKLKKIDLSKYKDTVSPLIEKDINNLLSNLSRFKNI